MFSHEERVKAIQLFLKYDCSYAATIRKLGYPSVGALRQWYKRIFGIWRAPSGTPEEVKVF